MTFFSVKDPGFKKILITVLIFLITIACIGLAFSYRSSQKMDGLTILLERGNPHTKPISEALLLINESENDFQLAITTNNQKSFFDYKKKLHLALGMIDSIMHAKPDSSLIENGKLNDSLTKLFQLKTTLSDSFFVLRSNLKSFNTDAEISVAGKTITQIIDSVQVARPRYTPPVITTDTTKAQTPPEPQKKKGLFGRLSDAIGNKNKNSISVETITINNRKTDSVILQMQSLITTSEAAQGKMLGNMKNRMTRLANIEARLLLANREIINKLKTLVSQLESISDSIYRQLKKMAHAQYQSHKLFINFLSISSLAFVVLLSLFLIKYINKMYEAKMQLKADNEAVNLLLSEKKDLLAVVSHEIRNPLTSLLGFMHALKSTNTSKNQLDMIESAEVSGKMLLSTVNDLLDMSKLESGTFQINKHRFNPHNVIQQAVHVIRINAEEKKLELNLSFTGDEKMTLLGDSDRLTQILVNLISNAIKFTSKGSIVVNASLITNEGRPALSVFVTDTGIGMTTDQQKKMFTKYYRTDSARRISGAGLGLYICHTLIRLQKGTISVTSELGKGSQFSFTIPYLAENNDLIETSENEDSNIRMDTTVFAGKRLLVVDDNMLNLKLIEVMAKPWNMQVVLMNRSTTALEYISRNGVDLVISDLHMPELDGLEFMKALKSDPITALIPIIISSGGNFTESELAEFKKAGFAGNISKPFTQIQLFKAIRAILDPSHAHQDAWVSEGSASSFA